MWLDSLSNLDIDLYSQRYFFSFQKIADPEIPFGFIPRNPLYPFSSIQSLMVSYLSTSLRPTKSGSTSSIYCCINFHRNFQSKNFAGTRSKFCVNLSANIFQCKNFTVFLGSGNLSVPSAFFFLFHVLLITSGFSGAGPDPSTPYP